MERLQLGQTGDEGEKRIQLGIRINFSRINSRINFVRKLSIQTSAGFIHTT